MKKMMKNEKERKKNMSIKKKRENMSMCKNEIK
jgi:hypothetical protein